MLLIQLWNDIENYNEKLLNYLTYPNFFESIFVNRSLLNKEGKLRLIKSNNIEVPGVGFYQQMNERGEWKWYCLILLFYCSYYYYYYSTSCSAPKRNNANSFISFAWNCVNQLENKNLLQVLAKRATFDSWFTYFLML
jgi:hypothetical protein